jgi:3-hydroxyisobutyrate dehydrogenase-like beta-hydroxyacid dehydrogenase
LGSAAEQLYLSASSQGFGRQDDSGLVRVYTPSTPTIVHEQAKSIASQSETLTPSLNPLNISKVGFIGLGAMGVGMATSLVRAGFNVCGFDVYEPSKKKFLAAGARASGAKSPVEAAQGATIFILMVQNAVQVEDVLFGAGKAADALPDSSIVILSSTVPPSFVKNLRQRLISLGRKLELIDAPVSGGVARAAQGELTVSWLCRFEISHTNNYVLDNIIR